MTLQIRHLRPVLKLQNGEVGLCFAPCCHLYSAEEPPTTMRRTPSRHLHMLPLPLLALHLPTTQSGGSGPRVDGGEADSASWKELLAPGVGGAPRGEERRSRGETGKRSRGTGARFRVREGGAEELEHGRARCLHWLLENGRTCCLRRWLEHWRSKRKLKMWTITVLPMDVWTIDFQMGRARLAARGTALKSTALTRLETRSIVPSAGPARQPFSAWAATSARRAGPRHSPI
jgi:hypothetical protein